MTVEIEEIKITRNWFTIWLMYVNGVNLSQHCKPCLKGFTSRKIHKNTKCLENVELNEAESEYYYLCGERKGRINHRIRIKWNKHKAKECGKDNFFRR